MRAGTRTWCWRRQAMRDKRIEHRQYIICHGEDMPEVREWQWGEAMRDITTGRT